MGKLYLAAGRQSPYASSLLGNLRHWLNEDAQIRPDMSGIGEIDRFEIMNRNYFLIFIYA
jgi:ArsR family transcriptional regulator, arsenate/arsenite/antimonite-responsive transcriptional repressor